MHFENGSYAESFLDIRQEMIIRVLIRGVGRNEAGKLSFWRIDIIGVGRTLFCISLLYLCCYKSALGIKDTLDKNCTFHPQPVLVVSEKYMNLVAQDRQQICNGRAVLLRAPFRQDQGC